MSVQQLYFSNKGRYIFLNLCGFEFIKIGDFYEADTPYGGKYPDYKLCIELIDNRLLHAGKSSYLVIRENKVTQKSNILYVGYYSQNLHNRWFYKKDDLLYSWHSEKLDTAINKIVTNTADSVSLWISANPFSEDGYNISKEIEDTILKEYDNDIPLNKTGKSLKDYHNSPTVLEILNLKELLDKN